MKRIPRPFIIVGVVLAIINVAFWATRSTCSPFDLQIAVIDDATNRPLIATISIMSDDVPLKPAYRAGAIVYTMCRGQMVHVSVTENGYAEWAVDVRAPANGTAAGLTGTARLKPLAVR